MQGLPRQPASFCQNPGESPRVWPNQGCVTTENRLLSKPDPEPGKPGASQSRAHKTETSPRGKRVFIEGLSDRCNLPVFYDTKELFFWCVWQVLPHKALAQRALQPRRFCAHTRTSLALSRAGFYLMLAPICPLLHRGAILAGSLWLQWQHLQPVHSLIIRSIGFLIYQLHFYEFMTPHVHIFCLLCAVFGSACVASTSQCARMFQKFILHWLKSRICLKFISSGLSFLLLSKYSIIIRVLWFLFKKTLKFSFGRIFLMAEIQRLFMDIP